MQTFLPLPSFRDSAKVLDRARLGKQRVECKQILAALGYKIVAGELRQLANEQRSGWVNHPAVRMWQGYQSALAVYSTEIIAEWIRRGYNNTMPQVDVTIIEHELPPWFGDPAFHASHRSNLLRKDPEWYGKFGWVESPGLEYVWP